MNILQSIESSDAAALEKQIDALKDIKSMASRRMITVLEAALALKEQLQKTTTDETKSRLMYAMLAHPWLTTEKMRRRAKQWNNAKEAITQNKVDAIVDIILKDMNEEKILEEKNMQKIEYTIKKTLGVQRLHIKTLYSIIGENNPYAKEKELHRDHIYYCALLRFLEREWQKGAPEYNRILHFVKHFKSHDKNAISLTPVGRIDLSKFEKDKKPQQKAEIKQEKTTNPLSLVGESKTSKQFLQCYNLDTIEKVKETIKEWKTIPARVVNIAEKFIFLTIGQEKLWGSNTRLFNISIPNFAFKKNNQKAEIGTIYAVKVQHVSPHNSKAWEWFMQWTLQDNWQQEVKDSWKIKSTLADSEGWAVLEKLKTTYNE